MKYVIISIYDGWFRFSITINGKIYDEDSELYKELYKVYNADYDDTIEFDFIKAFNNYLLERFKNYDLIVICEDGNIEILKENRGD